MKTDLDRSPSKSQLKRDMHALQVLGAELVALSAGRLACIELPEDLREAVVEAQRLTRHEARRRQLQFIGRLMRDVDSTLIREALTALNNQSASRRRKPTHQHWLERLLEDEATLTEIGHVFPGVDLQLLRALRRNALKERSENRLSKSYRKIFCLLGDMEPR